MSLIAEDNVFAMGTILMGLAYFGFWIDNRPIGKKTAGVVWVLVAAMALSNFRITPFSSPAYDFVGAYMVSLAIPLLLFKADIRKILRESGKVVITFAIASAATVIGAVLGFYLIDLGEIGPKVAGVFTGGWVGGAVNFLAVSQVVQMTETEFTSAISASSVVSILALMTLVAMPSIRLVTRFIPTSFTDTMAAHEKNELRETQRARIYLRHLSGSLALSFGICTVSASMAKFIAMPHVTILFVTLITLIIANLFPRMCESLEGEFELGMLFMYIFFAMVGSSTNATAFIGSAMNLFIYGMLMIIIHLCVVLIVAKVIKVDLAEAIVASGAALVGPAPTAAIAISQGWRSLVTPGIMCGILGYAIGTFIGVAVWTLLG